MKVSVLFSFRNEEDNISELIKRVIQSLSQVNEISYELVFVNDASDDRSLEILRSEQKILPITIVNMSRRFGVTPCVLAGMRHCNGDVIVYMDSDLQDPPELIPKLIEEYRNGFDVVHTTRTSRLGEGKFKMLATKVAYWVIDKAADLELPANTGDYKLLSRRVVDQILALEEVDPYMRGLSIWVGFKQKFVTYQRESRFSGKTHFGLTSSGPVREFLRGLTSFSTKPLYLSFYLGIVCFVFSIFLAIWAMYAKLAGSTSPGSASILISISFFSGVILFTQSLIGIYLARIYEQVKGRPRYIVQSVEK